MITKTKLERLSRKYRDALWNHLEKVSRMSLQAAGRIGREAVEMGLETLDLARMHDHAVTGFNLAEYAANKQVKMTEQAAVFFSHALIPIEKTHRLALEASAELTRLSASLIERTQEVEISQKKLHQGVIDRKTMETALQSSSTRSMQLLKEMRLLQEYLQEIAHLIMTAQEEERATISHTLQDVIAQTLLAIKMRLLVLKKDVARSNTDFKKEIATTQRLVEVSMKTINRFAHELGTPHAN